MILNIDTEAVTWRNEAVTWSTATIDSSEALSTSPCNTHDSSSLIPMQLLQCSAVLYSAPKAKGTKKECMYSIYHHNNFLSLKKHSVL